MANLQQRHAEPVGPPAVGVDIVFLKNGRLEEGFDLVEVAFGLDFGPDGIGEADRPAEVHLAVVAQAAGRILVAVEDEKPAGRVGCEEAEGGAQSGRSRADDDNVEFAFHAGSIAYLRRAVSRYVVFHLGAARLVGRWGGRSVR